MRLWNAAIDWLRGNDLLAADGQPPSEGYMDDLISGIAEREAEDAELICRLRASGGEPWEEKLLHEWDTNQIDRLR